MLTIVTNKKAYPFKYKHSKQRNKNTLSDYRATILHIESNTIYLQIILTNKQPLYKHKANKQ